VTEGEARQAAKSRGLRIHRDGCSGLYDLHQPGVPPDSRRSYVAILSQVTLDKVVAHLADPYTVDLDALRREQDAGWEPWEAKYGRVMPACGPGSRRSGKGLSPLAALGCQDFDGGLEFSGRVCCLGWWQGCSCTRRRRTPRDISAGTSQDGMSVSPRGRDTRYQPTVRGQQDSPPVLPDPVPDQGGKVRVVAQLVK
jgi:hypothetical protein